MTKPSFSMSGWEEENMKYLALMFLGFIAILAWTGIENKKLNLRECIQKPPEIIFTPTYIYNGHQLKDCPLTNEIPCNDFGKIIMTKEARGY